MEVTYLLGPLTMIIQFYTCFAAGSPYNEFKGVPFARPPVGELRWQKPVNPEPWDGIRDTKDFGSICTQNDKPLASEDCLFLNIYVPGSVSEPS